jgi:hypothetical protein
MGENLRAGEALWSRVYERASSEWSVYLLLAVETDGRQLGDFGFDPVQRRAIGRELNVAGRAALGAGE